MSQLFMIMRHIVLYSYWWRFSQRGTKQAVISSQHVHGPIGCTQCQFGKRWQREQLCTFTERN